MAARRQADRFFVVSVVAFLLSFAILVLLTDFDVGAVLAQVVALTLVTPLSFAGNKLWTFRRAVPVE